MAKKAGSKVDIFVKLVLVFFISLLSFSLGIYVGKQVSDSEYQAAKYEAKDYQKFRKMASLESEDEESHEAQGLSEEEIESLTEEFVNKEKDEQTDKKAEEHKEESHHADKHSKKEQHAKVAEHKVEKHAGHDEYKHHPRGSKKEHNKETKHHEVKNEEKIEKVAPKKQTSVSKSMKIEAPSSAAERVAMGAAPSKDVKPKRKPASVLPSVAGSSIGKYTVQVGSYATEKEAKMFSQKLKDKGYDAFYISAKVKSNTWYRVSVGLFDNYKSAEGFKKDLLKQAHVKAAFVQKIIK